MSNVSYLDVILIFLVVSGWLLLATGGYYWLRLVTAHSSMNADVSTFSFPGDFRNCLKNISSNNMIKLLFVHLNINSLSNKFDLVGEQIKGSIDRVPTKVRNELKRPKQSKTT